MNAYKNVLPTLFPHSVVATPDRCKHYINDLLSLRRKDVAQGSSFALTVDNWNGTWNLWLSEVSKDFLFNKYAGLELVK